MEIEGAPNSYLEINTISILWVIKLLYLLVNFDHEKAVQMINDKNSQAKFFPIATEYPSKYPSDLINVNRILSKFLNKLVMSNISHYVLRICFHSNIFKFMVNKDYINIYITDE